MKIGVALTSDRYDVWRLTRDGRVLGDSRGYSLAQAIVEAIAEAEHEDCELDEVSIRAARKLGAEKFPWLYGRRK